MINGFIEKNKMFFLGIMVFSIIFILMNQMPLMQYILYISGKINHVEMVRNTGYEALLEMDFSALLMFVSPFILVKILSTETKDQDKMTPDAVFLNKMKNYYTIIIVTAFASCIVTFMMASMFFGTGISEVRIPEVLAILLVLLSISTIVFFYGTIITLFNKRIKNGFVLVVLFFLVSIFDSILASIIERTCKNTNSTIIKTIPNLFLSKYLVYPITVNVYTVLSLILHLSISIMIIKKVSETKK